jgi:hypothetical protein
MPFQLTSKRLPLPSRTWWRWVVLAGLSALAACASPRHAGTPEEQALDDSPWARASMLPEPAAGAAWRHQAIGTRPTSTYTPGRHAGRPALKAESDHGDSLVHLPLAVESDAMGMLRFSWFVDALNTESDLGDGKHDDAVARVILQFGGDRTTFSARDNMVSDLLQALTGEPLPFATLIYVWDHRYPVGTILPHRRTQRIKTMVIESGPSRLGQWVDMERDVSADYVLAFGQAPQRLKGVALMTDANNTRQPTKAWYGPLVWQSKTAS